jgi:hypothetical protein
LRNKHGPIRFCHNATVFNFQPRSILAIGIVKKDIAVVEGDPVIDVCGEWMPAKLR